MHEEDCAVEKCLAMLTKLFHKAKAPETLFENSYSMALFLQHYPPLERLCADFIGVTEFQVFPTFKGGWLGLTQVDFSCVDPTMSYF
jgi:hypothetical protein